MSNLIKKGQLSPGSTFTISGIQGVKLNKAGDLKSIIMNGCRNINSDGISNFEYDKVNKKLTLNRITPSGDDYAVMEFPYGDTQLCPTKTEFTDNLRAFKGKIFSANRLKK